KKDADPRSGIELLAADDAASVGVLVPGLVPELPGAAGLEADHGRAAAEALGAADEGLGVVVAGGAAVVPLLEDRTHGRRPGVLGRDGVVVDLLLHRDRHLALEGDIRDRLGGLRLVAEALAVGVKDDEVAVGRAVDEDRAAREIVREKAIGRAGEPDRGDVV